MLADVFHFIEFMLLFAVGLIVLFFVLVRYASKLPAAIPVRILVMALSHRVAATAGLMALDPIASMVPVAGPAFDVVTLIGLGWYWVTFLRQLAATLRSSRPLTPR